MSVTWQALGYATYEPARLDSDGHRKTLLQQTLWCPDCRRFQAQYQEPSYQSVSCYRCWMHIRSNIAHAWYISAIERTAVSCAHVGGAALQVYRPQNAMHLLCREQHRRLGAFLALVADDLMVATVLILMSPHPIASSSLVGDDWLPVLPRLSVSEQPLTHLPLIALVHAE